VNSRRNNRNDRACGSAEPPLSPLPSHLAQPAPLPSHLDRGSAAILCPGPSLSRFDVARQEKYSLRIAVNRACTLPGLKPTHLVMLDAHTLSMQGMQAAVGRFQGPIVTILDQWKQMLANPKFHRMLRGCWLADRDLMRDPNSLGTALPATTEWPVYGMTTALAYAALFATEIHTYGTDHGLAGHSYLARTLDFDGHRDDRMKRNPIRWSREQRIWRNVCDRLGQIGVTVVNRGDGLAGTGQQVRGERVEGRVRSDRNNGSGRARGDAEPHLSPLPSHLSQPSQEQTPAGIEVTV